MVSIILQQLIAHQHQHLSLSYRKLTFLSYGKDAKETKGRETEQGTQQG